MKERLQRIVASLNLATKKTRIQTSFCIEEEVWSIASGGITLNFGRCVTEPSKWHAFISRQRPKDHPLDYLKPSIEFLVDRGRTRVVTFDPNEVTDQTLIKVMNKIREASSLEFLFSNT